jgi:Golgi phosphoprotein 3
MKPLTLPEHLLLLALRDDKGSVLQCSAVALPFGLAGAVILELSMRGRIAVDRKSVTVTCDDSTGDDILDTALANIRDSSRTRRLNYWISRPNSLLKGLQQRLLDRLVLRGILRNEEHHFLWLIPYHRYPEADGAPERNIRQKVHDVVLHGATADESTALLIALIGACGLGKEVFPGQKTREIKKRLQQFSEGEQVSKAVTDQVVAVTVALITASVATTTMSSSSS